MPFQQIGLADAAGGITGAELGSAGAQPNDLLVMVAKFGSGASLAGWSNLASYDDGTGTWFVGTRRYTGAESLVSTEGQVRILRGGNGTISSSGGGFEENGSFELTADTYTAGWNIGVDDVFNATNLFPSGSLSTWEYLASPTQPRFQIYSDNFSPGVIIQIPFAELPPQLSGTAATAAATVNPGSLRIPVPISGTEAGAGTEVSPGILSVPDGPITIVGDAPNSDAVVVVPPPVYALTLPSHIQDIGTLAGQFVVSVQVLFGDAPDVGAAVEPGSLLVPTVLDGAPAEATADVTPGQLEVPLSGEVPTGSAAVEPGSLESTLLLSSELANTTTEVTSGSLEVSAPPPVVIDGPPALGELGVEPGTLSSTDVVQGDVGVGTTEVLPGTLGTSQFLEGDPATVSAEVPTRTLGTGPTTLITRVRTNHRCTYGARTTHGGRMDTTIYLDNDYNFQVDVTGLNAQSGVDETVSNLTITAHLSLTDGGPPISDALRAMLTVAAQFPGRFLGRIDGTVLRAHHSATPFPDYVWVVTGDGENVQVSERAFVRRTRRPA